MQIIECPNCSHQFNVEDFSAGNCPNCRIASYYWDDDWDYIYELEGSPGFRWDIERKI